MILRYLLYSAEPLIAYTKRRLFKFYPAILRVCRKIYDEGYEILYHQKTAEATIAEDDKMSLLGHIRRRATLVNAVLRAVRRFTKWSITVKLLKCFEEHMPDRIRDNISFFIEEILLPIRNLELKGRIELKDYDEVKGVYLASNVGFANHLDFDDIAEQLFRLFSALRVKKADFVDQQGHPICSTLSLSRLMMSDKLRPSNFTLYELYADLNDFLEEELSEQSHRVVKARLHPLELARNQYDVDLFRSVLRPLLDYLIYYRGLIPPQHLARFAQDMAIIATDMGRITESFHGLGSLSRSERNERSQCWPWKGRVL
ncbi:hypothetical protein MMC29_000348 [Sticta canariensis]|nr:hypothetical protein [Sticta canariensis]